MLFPKIPFLSFLPSEREIARTQINTIVKKWRMTQWCNIGKRNTKRYCLKSAKTRKKNNKNVIKIPFLKRKKSCYVGKNTKANIKNLKVIRPL